MWVERGDVRLWAEVSGTGPTVVLQTGGAGAGSMWREYVPQLDGFRVVALDHRGRGRSSKPGSAEQHAMPEYVADVVALADALSVPRFGFVGYSMGAQVGYALAAAHPDRVAALVALGGPWEQVPDPTEPDELIDVLRTQGMPGLCTAVEDDEHLRLPDWLRQEFLGTDAEQFALSLDAWRGWTAWPQLGAVGCPTVVVAGELEDLELGNGEWAGRISDGQLAARGTASVTVRWLPGLGHVGAFLAAEQNSRTWVPKLRSAPGDR